MHDRSALHRLSKQRYEEDQALASEPYSNFGAGECFAAAGIKHAFAGVSATALVGSLLRTTQPKLRESSSRCLVCRIPTIFDV